MISKKLLTKLYVKDKMSAMEISKKVECSIGKINYWLSRHKIEKRDISEAIYVRGKKNSIPFSLKNINKTSDEFLFGLGLGLYWGEGNKKNLCSIKLGNTDPRLIIAFIDFLERIYSVKRKELRFGVQIFSDISADNVMEYWTRLLKVSVLQFQKPVITRSVRLGTYSERSVYGVLTVYFNDKKLRDIVCGEIENLYRLK